LNDKIIWKTLTNSWIQDWKWVWEWLLKKSWFDKTEIKDFKEWKLKWEKVAEKRALREMERASEVINKQFLNIQNEYISIFKWNMTLKDYSLNLLNKYWIKSNVARNRLNTLLTN